MKSLTRAALAFALVSGVVAVGSPALAQSESTLTSESTAHDGVGVFELQGRHPISATETHYVVKLTWSSDGHIADAATVTATATGLLGQTASVVLPYDAATERYMGTLTFPTPGLWTVHFEAVNPAAVFDSLELVPPLPGVI